MANVNTQKFWDRRYRSFGVTPGRVQSKLKGHKVLYDHIINVIEEYFRKYSLVVNSNFSVLDVGCGSGILLNMMIAAGLDGSLRHYRGYDFSETARRGFKARFGDDGASGRFQFSRVDLVRHPESVSYFGQYNLIVCCEFLEHIENDVEICEHIRKASMVGSRIIISVPISDASEFHLRGYTPRTFNERLGPIFHGYKDITLKQVDKWTVACYQF